MGILSVASIFAISASVAGVVSFRSFRNGTPISELATVGIMLTAISAGALIYLSLFTSLLGSDPIQFLTPSILGNRGERRTLLFIAMLSAGIGTLITLGVAKIFSRGKA